MKRYDIHVFPRRDWLGRLRWYFHGIANNGEIIFPSEAYRNKQDAADTADMILAGAADARVIVEGEDT